MLIRSDLLLASVSCLSLCAIIVIIGCNQSQLRRHCDGGVSQLQKCELEKTLFLSVASSSRLGAVVVRLRCACRPRSSLFASCAFACAFVRSFVWL